MERSGSSVTESMIDVSGVFGSHPTPGASAFADAIQESTILAIAGDIREMIASGQKVLNLTVGDFRPDQFPIPEGLRDYVIEALQSGETNYPPVPGVKELREAARETIREDFGLDYPLAGIFIGGGARPLIYSSFMALVDPGDLVVYPVPSWNNHHYVGMSGARSAELSINAEKNFHLDATDLQPHLSEARLLVLNSPLNPTGTCISRDAMDSICRAIVAENERRRGTDQRALFLLYDQVYNTLTFDAVKHYTPVELVPEMAPFTIMVDAVSKGLAGTGLRVGWAAGPPEIIKKMVSMAGHFGAWAPKPEQVATARFLRDRRKLLAFRKHIANELHARLDVIHRGMTDMREAGLPVQHIEPQGAIYLSVRFDLHGKTVAGRRIETNEDLRQVLLQEAGFAIIPFEAFGFSGENGWIRISVGAVSVAEITDGLARVRSLLESAV